MEFLFDLFLALMIAGPISGKNKYLPITLFLRKFLYI
jgi:hypothetical protein